MCDVCERDREKDREKVSVFEKKIMFCIDLLYYLIYYIICP